MNAPSVWPSLLAFAAVIAAIPLALALLKRAQVIRPGKRGMINVVGGVALGPRERVAVVEAGGKWLVLGVTSQTINLLTTLDQAPDGGLAAGPRDPLPAGPVSFGHLFNRFKSNDPSNS